MRVCRPLVDALQMIGNKGEPEFDQLTGLINSHKMCMGIIKKNYHYLNAGISYHVRKVNVGWRPANKKIVFAQQTSS